MGSRGEEWRWGVQVRSGGGEWRWGVEVGSGGGGERWPGGRTSPLLAAILLPEDDGRAEYVEEHERAEDP